MTEIELSSSQYRILSSLVSLHRAHGDSVKGKEVAEAVDRNPGTIRNKMQSLKDLSLVEGVVGPNGGYKPTEDAYKLLEIDESGGLNSLPLLRNGYPVEGATVAEIDLKSINHPTLCRAEIQIKGDIHEFHENDKIKIGPTIYGFIIYGSVDVKDDDSSRIVVGVEEMKVV
ncbi:MAG: TrmB family transcriptional regulator [Halobacteria archaeon]|nr:TrmB family transcriptional regulator [Halobacteria archaeon]